MHGDYTVVRRPQKADDGRASDAGSATPSADRLAGPACFNEQRGPLGAGPSAEQMLQDVVMQLGIQKVLYFVSAPSDPSACTVSLTW
jgi:hypothetical protein